MIPAVSFGSVFKTNYSFDRIHICIIVIIPDRQQGRGSMNSTDSSAKAFFAQALVFIMTFCCVSLSVMNAQANIKLAKLPNWNAISLTPRAGIFIRPADSTHNTLVASWNGYKVIVSEAGNPTPVFIRVFDNEIDSLHSVVVGDFDSDGVVEVAMLVFDFRTFGRLSPWESFTDDTLELHLISNEIGAIPSCDTVTYIVERPWSFIDLTYFPLPITLSAEDLNSDGNENIVFSVGWLYQTPVAFFVRNESAGATTIWDSFPNRIDTVLSYPVSRIDRADGRYSFMKRYHYRFDEILSPDLEIRTAFLSILDASYDLHGFPTENTWCQTDYQNYSLGSQSLLVSGYTLLDTASRGALIRQSGQTDDCFNVSYSEMFELDDTLGVTSIWKKDEFKYSTYVFNKQKPGRFMAIGNKTLFEFASATGEKIDSTLEPLPAGILGWHDLFGDGDKYLVTLNDTLLEAYGFDFVTDVADEDNVTLLPESFELSQPYPNPFNPSVSFSITSKRKTDVTVDIYNVLGQRVAEIFSGELHTGKTTFTWNATDNSSGIYFIRAKTKDGPTETRKAVLLK